MEYQFKSLRGRMQIFLDTGERFYPSEPLPKDHLFEAGLNLSFRLNDPKTLVAKPVNDWMDAIPLAMANAVAVTLIKMGRVIRFGSSDITADEPCYIDWTVEDEGYTDVAVHINVLFEELNDAFGGPSALLLSMERFICAEIGNSLITDKITELPFGDKNIRFTEQQMLQLSTLAIFSKLVIPIYNTYYASFVRKVGPVQRPWLLIRCLFQQTIDEYCPELLKLLRVYVRSHIRETQWESSVLLDDEAELQLQEYLWYGLPLIDLYNTDLRMFDTVTRVFNNQ